MAKELLLKKKSGYFQNLLIVTFNFLEGIETQNNESYLIKPPTEGHVLLSHPPPVLHSHSPVFVLYLNLTE